MQEGGDSSEPIPKTGITFREKRRMKEDAIGSRVRGYGSEGPEKIQFQIRPQDQKESEKRAGGPSSIAQ